MKAISKIVLFLAFAFLHVDGSNDSDIKTVARVNAESNLKTQSSVNAEGDLSSSSTQCGGVLKGPSGTISYKPYSEVTENERCVWTVRTPNATSYRFTLSKLGSPYSVIISGVTTTGSLSQLVLSYPSSSTYSVSGSLAVITFFSTNVTGNGFSLTYSSYAYNGAEGNTSREVVAPSNIGSIRHPPNGLTYANLDLSVFVFLPSCVNNFEKITQVIYIKDALEGTTCNDKLQLYRFDATVSSTSKWISIGEICGGSESEVISSRDLIMIVFRSDGSVVNTGFHLYSNTI